jgi:hypothetical protein
MGPVFLLVASLAVTVQGGLQARPPDPGLVRVYVHTDDDGELAELAARRTSVTDLGAAIKAKKKDLVVVSERDAADVVLEVMDRAFIVPRVVFGLGNKPGELPPAGTSPVRAVQLRVRLEIVGRDSPPDFRNRNSPRESSGGWRSAADDIAKQVQAWIVERRAAILAAR